MIPETWQKVSLNPADAIDSDPSPEEQIADFEDSVRLDEKCRLRVESDKNWDNDQTFFLRAKKHFSDNLLSNSELYQAEASRILHGLRKRNKKTRVWLTGKLEALAKEFPEYDDN